MTEQLKPPRRKDPLRRTVVPTMPPQSRSRRAHGYTQAAAEGRFMLQKCLGCGAFLYPAHDACPVCLGAELPFVDAPRGGVLLADSIVRVPAEPYFRERAPWRIGIAGLDCGPKIVTHLHGDCVEGGRVRLSFQLDRGGNAVAFAQPEESVPHMEDDRLLREMTADPKFRRVLITNGRSAVGRAMVTAMQEAGASIVFVGVQDGWKPWPEEAAMRASGAQIVALDVGDEKSVKDAADSIGGKVDILINTAEHIRPGGLLGRQGVATFRDELDQTYLGFVHLAQNFGPIMRARGADGVNSAAAWVNILSVYALANWAPWGAYSASQAALLSLSHCLRAELRPGGVKVVNIFTGPTETEWFQPLLPPKVAPQALARAVVAALRAGTEDAFVGDIAEDIRNRVAANPKAAERELGE